MEACGTEPVIGWGAWKLFKANGTELQRRSRAGVLIPGDSHQFGQNF